MVIKLDTVTYLTIDDAPSSDFNRKVELLEEKEIPAIFFCQGNLLAKEKRQKQLIEAIQRGFTIGNHSYSHPYFSQLNLEQGQEEIAHTEQLIDQLYQQADVDRRHKVFRFPYLDKGWGSGRQWQQATEEEKRKARKLQQFLEDKGFVKPDFEKISYDWCRQETCGVNSLRQDYDWYVTFDLEEYRDDLTLEQVVDRIKNSDRLNSNSADIILTHDHQQTASYFATIIRTLQHKTDLTCPWPQD